MVENQPFVSALGRSCTVYVERDNAELYAPHLEHLIVAGGGTVTRDPDQAAVVVVFRRGMDTIESRIAQTWYLRQIDPWIQGVVDVDWVNDCIKKAELQGPPDWGGYLLAPREAVISERAVRDAVSAVFGRPAMQADPRARRTVNEDAEQVGPGRTIEPPQRDPPGSRTEVSRERGRRGPEPCDVWDRVQAVVKREIHSSKLKHYTHGDVLDLILFLARKEADSQMGLWDAFARMQASKSAESNRSKNAWNNFYTRNKEVIDKCVGILRAAGYSSGDLRQLRDKSSSRRAWRSRSREGKRNAVESDQESDEESVGTRSRPDNQARRRPRSSSMSDASMRSRRDDRTVGATSGNPSDSAGLTTSGAKGNQGGNPTQYTNEDTIAAIMLFADRNNSVLLNEKLPPVWKDICDAFIQERIAANPTRVLREDQGVWSRWARRHWDIISTGAIALKGNPQLRANVAHPAQARLSTSAGGHVPADFDEMVDFIAKQIKVRRVSEQEEKDAMSQDFIWKAFAVVHRTNRSWKEWQRYYNERADDINRAARLRLKPGSHSGSLPADPLIPQVEAQMALLATSSEYPSPPVSRPSLKRPLDAPTDGARPKHIRPNN